jgi:hypothetical protein
MSGADDGGMMRTLLMAAALLGAPSPAFGSNWGSYAEWEVTGDESDNTCMFAREFEGTSFGFQSGGTGLFGLPFRDLTFLDVVSQASSADFYRIDGEGDDAKLTTVDELKLDGTGAAVGALKRCLAHQRNLVGAAERYRKKWEHIPADPFAKP